MPLFNRRRQLPSDQFSRAEGNAMIPRWTRPPERNTYDWIKMFSKSPRLSVVERIASDLSFATGKLYVVGSDGEESEITRHSFLNFWAQPNPCTNSRQQPCGGSRRFTSSSRARATSSSRKTPQAARQSFGRYRPIG